MLISSLITDFLEYLEIERNASQLTIKNYDHYLKRFLQFASDIDPKEIDLELIRRYKFYLSRFPIKRITQNYFMIALRTFLRYLAKLNIDTLSYGQVELGENEPAPLKVLDESYLKQLLTAPDVSKKSGLRDKAILETLFSTGLRVSELASLNCDVINFNRREFGIVGKGGKERMVFVSDSAALWLKKYLDVRKDTFKPLFIRFQGKADPSKEGVSMRLTPRSIERIVEKYVKKLGLPVKATPHTLRHAYLTHTRCVP